MGLTITFIDPRGKPVEVQAEPGDNLLRLGQSAGLPLEGTCEGQMACSTCHVIVAAEDFARLPPASEMEDDMLDLAACVTRHSRLACQIEIDEAVDALTVRIPPDSRDMRAA